MILYHGSNIDIKEIDLNKSKVGKDFGCGFYLTPDKNQAYRMAEKKILIIGQGMPVLNKYEFDESLLQSYSLNILKFDAYTKEWADFVLMNRRNLSHVPTHDYDIVIGPIANDSVGYQIRRYIEGIIDMDRFIEELKYMTQVSEVKIQYSMPSVQVGLVMPFCDCQQ